MIIGIGGVSNSGKSGLAEKIRESYPGQKIKIICQDDHVFPKEQLPTIKNHIDWEHPDSIDSIKFKKSILEASQVNDITIAEGLMVFYFSEITQLFNKLLFIEISHPEFIKRKKRDLRWGKEPHWYIQHIWKSYNSFGKAPAVEKLKIINGESPIIVEDILNFLNK
ncbi:MAG: hypothetical protein K9H49_02080 [Bacteroidales bacterium]|nr:hypothetical protein [Bacteroidales bacterium]MCF8403357.1 hypothetical protein [Bacteroidales bacterium]